MTPLATTADVINLSLANPKAGLNKTAFSAVLQELSDSQNISSGQFGAPIVDAGVVTNKCAILRNLVPCIVQLGAKKKVTRIATGRVIAVVKDMQVVGYRPVVDYPRDTVCSQWASPPTTTADRSIAISRGARPTPAFAVSIMDDLGPITCLYGSEDILHSNSIAGLE